MGHRGNNWDSHGKYRGIPWESPWESHGTSPGGAHESLLGSRGTARDIETLRYAALGDVGGLSEWVLVVWSKKRYFVYGVTNARYHRTVEKKKWRCNLCCAGLPCYHSI